MITDDASWVPEQLARLALRDPDEVIRSDDRPRGHTAVLRVSFDAYDFTLLTPKYGAKWDFPTFLNTALFLPAGLAKVRFPPRIGEYVKTGMALLPMSRPSRPPPPSCQPPSSPGLPGCMPSSPDTSASAADNIFHDFSYIF